MAPRYARQSGTARRSIGRQALTPALLAYVLGLLSTTSPRLVQIAASVLRGKTTIAEGISKIREVVRRQLAPDTFATSCALLVASVTAVPKFTLYFLQQRNGRSTSRNFDERSLRLITFGSSLMTSGLSFLLLNRSIGRVSTPYVNNKDSQTSSTPPVAGQTLGLTFFGVVRALDIIISALWRRNKFRRHGKAAGTSFEISVEKFIAPCVFAASSLVIMWTWFFSPDRLPRAYNKWISSAAQIDERLIDALRQCRRNKFFYGANKGMSPTLEDMCEDLGYPKIWGDTSKTIPVPCELYHSGYGPNCEYHAVRRFIRAWSFAMQMYLPLNLLMLLRKEPSRREPARVLSEASRSSTFLGSFVALFYYGVCLARTRLGPKLFSRQTVTPQMWDGGLCVGTGCFACGWSILLEKPGRREEIAFFVAPRALSAFFPRRYDRKYISVEGLMYTLSAAIIMSTAAQKPNHVRGVFGSILEKIIHA